MYTRDQLNDKVIWIFSEVRSGSTWLLDVLSRQLNRTPMFIFKDRRYEEVINTKFQPSNVKDILYTHYFDALEIVKNYNNPIVIRTSRKNKTEQLLSSYLVRVTNISQVRSNNIQNYPTLEPIVIPMEKVEMLLEIERHDSSLWNKYAKYYENETVYYEDLLEGWNSKILPIKLSMNDYYDIDLPIRIPYNKREIILNYDEVDTYIKKELGIS